jgi:hypothetical protein
MKQHVGPVEGKKALKILETMMNVSRQLHAASIQLDDGLLPGARSSLEFGLFPF